MTQPELAVLRNSLEQFLKWTDELDAETIRKLQTNEFVARVYDLHVRQRKEIESVLNMVRVKERSA